MIQNHEHFTENFKWENEDQKKGFLNLIQYLIKKTPDGFEGFSPEITAAYFIQKDKESHEWWADTVAGQFEMLRKEIMSLQLQIQEIRGRQ